MESPDLLPNELFKMIISYLDVQTAQNVSLTSKKMYWISQSRLWSKPRYHKPKNIDFLHTISKFPICELHTRDFDCDWVEILYMVPQLKLLHIDTSSHYFKTGNCLRYLKVPVVLHTDSFRMEEIGQFERFLEIIDLNNVKEVLINHSQFYDKCFGKGQRAFTFDEFKTLAAKVYISEIHVNCIRLLHEENVINFIKIVASIKNCQVILRN